MTAASVSRTVFGTFRRLVEWLRNLGAQRERPGEHTGGNVGVTTGEFDSVAAKRPSVAGQLKLRHEALNSERAALGRTDSMQDIERVCAICGSKRQCERDLARHPDDPVWRTYCPNAHLNEMARIRASLPNISYAQRNEVSKIAKAIKRIK